MNVFLFGTDPAYLYRIQCYLESQYEVRRFVRSGQLDQVFRALGSGEFQVVVLACDELLQEHWQPFFQYIMGLKQTSELRILWCSNRAGGKEAGPLGNLSLLVLNAQYAAVQGRALLPEPWSRPMLAPGVLCLEHQGVQYQIRYDSILYVEVNYKQLDIVTDETTHSLRRCSLQRVRQALPPDVFVQCHRSYVVNHNKITAVSLRSRKPSLAIGPVRIPVGKHYCKNILPVGN